MGAEMVELDRFRKMVESGFEEFTGGFQIFCIECGLSGESVIVHGCGHGAFQIKAPRFDGIVGSREESFFAMGLGVRIGLQAEVGFERFCGKGGSAEFPFELSEL